MNITISDWAGWEKKQKEDILNSQFYLQYEDALIEETKKTRLLYTLSELASNNSNNYNSNYTRIDN